MAGRTEGSARRRVLSVFAGLMATAALFFSMASAASALPPQFYGLDVGAGSFNSEPDWAVIEHSGAKMAHMQFNWQTVASGGWASTYDQYIQKAVSHGEQILPYLYGRKDGTTPYYTESEWNEYENVFVKEAVQRYGYNGSFWTTNSNPCFHPGQSCYRPIWTWEVWNEPNFNTNSPGGTANGKTYAKFLKRTSEAITSGQNAIEGNPHTTLVLVGGIYQGEDRGMAFSTFMAQVKELAGINSYYDGLGIHPYGFGSKGLATTEAARLLSLEGHVEEARKTLTGMCTACSGKSLWVTEFGWGVEGSGPSGSLVSPSEQSSLLRSSYSWLVGASSADKIEYAAWYLYKDACCPGDWAQYAGLRDGNGAYRPSWWGYQAQTGASPFPGGTIDFQANSTQLYSLAASAGSVNWGLGMKAGTSPGIATLSNGEYVMALQANTSTLWVSSPAGGSGNTSLGMAAGTSPSIAGSLTGAEYLIAFQGNDGALWTRSSAGPYGQTSLGMKASTSPAIATLSNGEYMIAFQGNDGALWTRSSSGPYGQTGLGMAAGTSPSITALPKGEYLIAFQGNDGALWTRSSAGPYGQTGLGMAAGTSPSIASLPNGEYMMAFQANDGTLWTRSSSGAYGKTGFGMAAGTSPSITALPNGEYMIAFQGNDGALWTRSSSGAFNKTGLGMAAGTSPSISPPSRW